ncbi:putative Ig domain-containing protein [Streptomyces sp. TBY4]|uniref:putative Ig domain-containing protein n=1 Tax=Streptomyces sp. TBY4 TaxID=2962030 RepID=UPI0020B66AD6|nr:putative Ig domain-containing protein [Streptomyces sp. TBY4]MCP3754790.1 putative Ig domain-containing protein [Streptomyces sp. TBY4]
MRSLSNRSKWASATAASVTAVVALSGLGVLPAHATAATAPAAPQVLEAMQRDLHLSAGQVRDRIADEAAAGKAATVIRGRVGDRVAGLWFDSSTGRLNAAVSSAADAALVRDAGAVARPVRYSRAELAATARTVTRDIGSGIAGVVSWGPDVRNNRIDVTVDRTARNASTDAFVARLAALGGIVHVTETDGGPRQQADVTGGEKWVPGSESPCSIGFAATRVTGGAKTFLTAGHCTNDVNQAAYGKDGTRVGTSNKDGRSSVNAREGDMGVVDVDQSGWNLSPYVAGDATHTTVPVTGSADAVVGTAICRSGQTTGMRCGEVTKVDQSVDYGNVVIDGLSYSNACSAGGDSGGAYVTATGGKAVGLHSGGGSATCTSGSGEKFTIFQPVVEALSRFNLALVVTAPQPGNVTVAAVSAQNGVIGARIPELRNSAEGGTAPYTWSATGLPAGLAIDSSTGTITGTPTTAGTSNVTVTATDNAGKTGSASFSWTITTAGTALSVTNPGSQSSAVGAAASLTVKAAGGTAPYSWSATGLPAGLSIGSSTGTVTGTATTAGTSSVTVTATDSAGKSASATFSWTVTTVTGTSPVLTNPGNQVVYIGKPVSLSLQTTGGTKPYAFKATGLPAGLSINAATGVITGSPTTWGFGSSTLTVTDAAGKSSSVSVTWNVYF